MGFGSYDESEQEQPTEPDEADRGEDVTAEFHQATHEGTAEMADLTPEEMLEHL